MQLDRREKMLKEHNDFNSKMFPWLSEDDGYLYGECDENAINCDDDDDQCLPHSEEHGAVIMD